MNNKAITHSQLSILSLEDSELDFEMIREHLLAADFDFHIKRVDKEQDFISSLKNNSYDLILADYNLPGYDGYEALKIHMQICPETPFICISGSIGETAAIELLKQGAVDYVLKDKMERLPFAVKRALDEAEDRRQRHESELELARSEEKFRNLFENDSAPKAIICPGTLQLVEVNAAAARFFGWTVDEMKQMKISQLNLAGEEEIYKKLDQVRKNENLSFEFQFRVKDEMIKDAEVFSSMIRIGDQEYMHAILHDITDKKKAEQQLRLLSLSIDQSPVGISITGKDHKIEYVNPAFTQITGFGSEDLIGKTPAELHIETIEHEELNNIKETISSGKIWSGEFKSRRKSGELFWQKLSISPLFNDNGEITHYVNVKEDITEKRKMLEDLIESKERAEASDRLKSSFINNISHEIRTPLNGILGFGQILASDVLSPEEKAGYLVHLNQSSERLINTVTNIMDISLLNSGNQKVFKKEFILSTLINDVVSKFEDAVQSRKLTLNYQVHTKKDKVFTDSELLGKSIYQIIDNALKFTYQGNIVIDYELKDGTFEFMIKDTGIGISQEYHDKIFGSFIQENTSVTRGYEGNGIGLSIAKGFIGLLGGKIGLESEKGRGSTFYISIPNIVRLDDRKQMETQHSDISSKKATILVAEDDEANYLYVEALLRKSPIKLIHAENGEVAVEKIKNHPEISMVIMDLKMPVMDGFEATQKIKEMNARMPVIALTAYSGSDEKQRALGSGCSDLLLKPLKKELLLKKLEEYGFEVG